MKKFIAIFMMLLVIFLISCSTENAQKETVNPPKESEVISTPSVNNTEQPAQVETIETSVPEKVYLKYESEENYFELPINGTTGFAPIFLNVRAEADANASLLVTLKQGSVFIILEENGDWWKIDTNGTIGHVNHMYAMINLPDVLPSAVYKNTNASASILKSSFIDIPNITGAELYTAYGFNERLGRDEFIMPVLYSTAKKIAEAQHFALQDGNTLVINELYRPYEVQQKIVSNLTNLSNSNSEVMTGISKSPWSISWFIATSLSNHQRGYAMDTSLGKVSEFGIGISGEYEFMTIASYEEYEMQTPIHELSYRSAGLSIPVSSKNDTEWRAVPVSENFTAGSSLLRDYCTNAGLSPLASEWWHFNDLEIMGSATSVGDYYIDEILSKPPTV